MVDSCLYLWYCACTTFLVTVAIGCAVYIHCAPLPAPRTAVVGCHDALVTLRTVHGAAPCVVGLIRRGCFHSGYVVRQLETDQRPRPARCQIIHRQLTPLRAGPEAIVLWRVRDEPTGRPRAVVNRQDV